MLCSLLCIYYSLWKLSSSLRLYLGPGYAPSVTLCPFPHRSAASRRSENCALQSFVRTQTWRTVDSENRGHGRSMFPSCTRRWSIETAHQSLFVPNSLDSIRKGLEWAGLEYNFGEYFPQRKFNFIERMNRTRNRWLPCTLFPSRHECSNKYLFLRTLYSHRGSTFTMNIQSASWKSVSFP
jgi:hypothetical protein